MFDEFSRFCQDLSGIPVGSQWDLSGNYYEIMVSMLFHPCTLCSVMWVSSDDVGRHTTRDNIYDQGPQMMINHDKYDRG